jgi:prephenate dehydrogenase
MIKELVIVGVGLIGGSLARAARQHQLAQDIIGIDEKASQAILDLGLVDQSFQSLQDYFKARHGDDASAVDEADVDAKGRVLVLAAPPSVCAELLAAVVDGPQHFWSALTDVSSTKHALLQSLATLQDQAKSDAHLHKRVERLLTRYVSSHPMAGSELNGPAASHADLFVGARVFVSALHQTREKSLARIESLWLGMGAIPSVLPIEDHDALLAAISHFPHLVSFALADMLSRSVQASAAQSLHGGGLRDTTRIAGSSPSLWADILLDNRDEVLQLVPQWQLALNEVVSSLQADDRDGLVQILSQASQWRRQFS